MPWSYFSRKPILFSFTDTGLIQVFTSWPVDGYGNLHDGLPTSTFLPNPVQHIVSGQEPGGKLHCRFESQARPTGLRHVALSLGSSAFYLGSEVEVVPACLPPEPLTLLCSALLWAAQGVPFRLRLSPASRWRDGVGSGKETAGQVSSRRARLGRLPSVPHSSSSLAAACRGSVLTLTPDPCPRPLAALPPPFVLPAQG